MSFVRKKLLYFQEQVLPGLPWLRAALGLILLLDLVRRLFTGLFFLTDQGPLPVAALQNWILLSKDPLLSLHALSGSETFVAALLTLQIIIAAFFTAGWRPLTTGWISWILLLSLQQRNELLLHGADVLLSVELLWLNLISTERRLAGIGRVNWSLLFFYGHILLTYAAAVLSKQSPMWIDGKAAQYLIEMDLQIRSYARGLAEFPLLLRLFNYLTLATEAATLPAMITSIFSARFRKSWACVMMTFHLGLLAVINVGNFSLIYLSFWFFFAGWFKPTAIAHRPGRGLLTVRFFACVIFAMAFSMFSVTSLKVKEFRPRAWQSLSRVLKVVHPWQLFTLKLPRASQVDVFPGPSENPGTSFFTGAPWDKDRPWPLGPSSRDHRWMLYLHRLRLPRWQPLYGYLGVYLCRQWPKETEFTLRQQFFNRDKLGRESEEILARWKCEPTVRPAGEMQ